MKSFQLSVPQTQTAASQRSTATYFKSVRSCSNIYHITYPSERERLIVSTEYRFVNLQLCVPK